MSAVSLLPDRPPYFNPSPTFKKVGQFVEKVCFFKKMLVLNPYPQTPFPGKGAKCGAAALTPLGATPQTPFFKVM